MKNYLELSIGVRGWEWQSARPSAEDVLLLASRTKLYRMTVVLCFVSRSASFVHAAEKQAAALSEFHLGAA